jgi:hypothetical protein
MDAVGVQRDDRDRARRWTWARGGAALGWLLDHPPLLSCASAASGDQLRLGQVGQYLRGISLRIIDSFSRAGLKMLW